VLLKKENIMKVIFEVLFCVIAIVLVYLYYDNVHAVMPYLKF